MNKYLIELIKLQNSVILPGFGALMIGNSKSGKVVFNPHLKFNDGALAKFISEKEGIDVQAAQNQIAKFVREIEAELGKGNSFDIFQFGKFTKKADGSIDFIQDPGAAAIADANSSKPAPAVKKSETVKPAESTKTEAKPAVEKPIEIPKAKPVESTEQSGSIGSHANEAKETSLLDKLKSGERELTQKAAEPKTALEETLSKQTKNSFKPADETAQINPETTKPDVKPIPISKTIPLAEASKKEPVAQVKNSFKPAEETSASKSAEEPKASAETAPVTTSVKEPEAVKPTEETKPKKGEEKPKKEAVKEKFKKDKPQKIKHENPEAKKPKKKKRWVFWLIILIILGGGTTAGWLYKDQINHFLFAGVGEQNSDSTHAQTEPVLHDSTTVSEHELPLADDTTQVEASVETDDETVTEPIEEVKEEPGINHTSPGGTYHIIGNSFSSENNANNYVKKMTEKGYSAQNIGKYNGLYLVSIKSFGSREEAKNNLSSVQADAPGAYVMKAN